MRSALDYPWTVDADPEDAKCWSIWTDVPGAANAEVVGRIYERAVAVAIVRQHNENRGK